ncbi:RNA polymerase sigma factor [Novosphingobium sp.]|uniref:RNA polymerase sigma factor n=1 Tax=Novosphingobium sp. TaxID=1874826 RepID=UPI003BAD4D4E
MDAARRRSSAAAEQAARASYGRLLALVSARTRDIAAAEDALAEAFAAALAQWGEQGVPANPEAWLLTVARRVAGHQQARAATASRAGDVLALLAEEREDTAASPFSDQRLALLFVCAHPAIDPDAQAPLMLQTVLGLDASRIAAAFLVGSGAMGQRLVRAKRKIRDAGIAFAVPDPADAPQRLGGVLSAIYAAYGTAWDDTLGADSRLAGLRGEALFLARLIAELMPDQPEALGLLALILHCEARQPARRAPDGTFVPLHAQDPLLWSREMVVEAETALRRAATFGAPGRFQTEAAIQSLHAHQRMTGERFTGPLARLYDVLAGIAPTTGVMVARAVAHAENGASSAALEQLRAMTGTQTYQPWWAALARVSWLAGDAQGAAAAAATAAGLSADPAIRAFLLGGGYRFAAGGANAGKRG